MPSRTSGCSPVTASIRRAHWPSCSPASRCCASVSPRPSTTRSPSASPCVLGFRPLTDSELTLFLDKHLRAAGAKSNLFEPDAVTLVFQHSRGIPRLAQNLALGALLATATANKKTVDADAVQQAGGRSSRGQRAVWKGHVRVRGVCGR